MKAEELDKLTPKQKRVKIAEACGLLKRKEGEVIEYQDFRAPNSVYQRVAFPNGSVRPCYRENIPNYLTSLDAMHEAEKTLNREQRIEYVRRLYQLTSGDFEFHCATAAQRADAFLLTLSPVTREQPHNGKAKE